MKHVKKYSSLDYEEGDIVKYKRYENDKANFVVKILRVTPTSSYPYFVESIKKPYKTFVLQPGDLEPLTQEEAEFYKMRSDAKKYNI